MSVSIQNPRTEYTGNGASKLFAFPWYCGSSDDLVVTVAGAAVASGYTATGFGLNSGGVVEFATAPGVGVPVVLFRQTALARDTNYQVAGDLLASTVNADFDRLWQAMQDIGAGSIEIASVLRVPAGEVLSPLPSLDALEGRVLGVAGRQIVGVVPASGSAADLALALASGAGSAQVGYLNAAAGAVARSLQARLSDVAHVTDFLSIAQRADADGSPTLDCTAAIQAALNSGAKTVDFLGLALRCDAVTVPAGVWAKNVNLLKHTNAPGNVVQVNTGCTVTGNVAGSGLTNAVQRCVYPAADGVTDVSLHVDVSNATFGVHAQYLSTDSASNRPARWTGYVYAHDIVGAVGVSEGYGVLLSPADACDLTVRARNIRRHAVYLSAGASYNSIDADCDGCGNYALQFNALVPQAPCLMNEVTIRARNLTTDVAGQSGALAILGNCHENTCRVFCVGNATTFEAVRVEGGSVGVQANHPRGNKIVEGSIMGQFTGGDVVRLINADGTHVARNSINAYAASTVIASRRTGTNVSTHGGHIYDNSINAQAQAIKGVYIEVNTVPSYVGPNDIRNNSSALRVDDQTGGKRNGYSRRVTFGGTTASIGAASSGDTVATLADGIQTTGRRSAVVMTGSSGTFFNSAHSVVGVTAAPAETQIVFRLYNAAAAAQTFDYVGWVEGD